MTEAITRPRILPFYAGNVPDVLKRFPRWTPWKAVWLEEQQNVSKVRHSRKSTHHGISTAKPKHWGTFYNAHKSHVDNPGQFAGLGFRPTGVSDLVAIELDNRVAEHVIATLCVESVAKNIRVCRVVTVWPGLCVLLKSNIEQGWTNHKQGIEVSDGHKARSITISGHPTHAVYKTVDCLNARFLSQRSPLVRAAECGRACSVDGLADEIDAELAHKPFED